MILSELLKAKPGLWSFILQNEDNGAGVEQFSDAEDEEQLGSSAQGKRSTSGGPSTSCAVASKDGQWVWPSAEGGYDMQKREPLFAGGERSCWWELCALASHLHPSTAAMARQLLAGTNIEYHGDPLRDLTVTAFLDKFMQKKAKDPRGSLMQPLTKPSAQSSVTSAAFAALAEQDVAPEELFFHRYYNLQGVQSKRQSKQTTKPRRNGSDSESEDEMDDFLAHEEDVGGDELKADPDDEYDYNQLAAAMDDDDDNSDAGPSGDDAASVGSEDLNPFELPSPSDSDIPSSDDASSSGSDLDNNVMNGGGRRRKRGKSSVSVFASVDDYADILDKAEGSGSDEDSHEAIHQPPSKKKKTGAVKHDDGQGSQAEQHKGKAKGKAKGNIKSKE